MNELLWKELYEVSLRIKDLKPWETFESLDLFTIKDNNEEPVYISILGNAGIDYGIYVFENEEAYNHFMLLSDPKNDLSNSLLEYLQNCLSCNFGNRDELTKEQKDIIKKLGYKFRGKNQWIYFQSYETGYIPYNFNEDEVIRMTKYLKYLEIALNEYDKNPISADFDKLESYHLEVNKDEYKFSIGTLPFNNYVNKYNYTQPDYLLEEIEANVFYYNEIEIQLDALDYCITDKKHKKPIVNLAYVAADAATGNILEHNILTVEDHPFNYINNMLCMLILYYGKPAHVYASNILVYYALKDLCYKCGISLLLSNVGICDTMIDYLNIN